jgi:two-component system, NtrC family, response regulator
MNQNMNQNKKVLIVDDEPSLRKLMARLISLEGYTVVEEDALTSGKKMLLKEVPDVVLLDVFLPDGNGVEVVPEWSKLLPDGKIILLTAHGNIQDGVSAIKNGAYDYLVKGDDNVRIIPMIGRACEEIGLRQKVNQLKKIIDKEYSFDTIIGQSKPLLAAIDMARKVAPTDTTILLTGETGTGKEVFAGAIHQLSNRRNGSFVALNCGALSSELLESELFGYKAGAFTGAAKDKRGLFDQAKNGTLFLDEIGEMPLSLQVKMLRVLETDDYIPVGDTISHHADVRVIAATNRHLKEEITQGNFREDLFYRLSIFSIDLPPLRERGDDIRLLAENFMQAFAHRQNKTIHGMDDAFIALIRRYPWKGNIRELRNVMERSVILASGDKLMAQDLPLEVQWNEGKGGDGLELASIERQHIIKMLAYTGGNKTEAARLMKIGLTTLYRKIEEYGIK